MSEMPHDSEALVRAVNLLVTMVGIWFVGLSGLLYLAVRILGAEMQIAALRIVQALNEKKGGDS